MADEPALPKLSLTPNDESFLSNPRPSKRVRLHNTSPLMSSDPPFFSSDDDPSVENYLGLNGRQKKQFRGPWYGQEPEELGDRKRKRKLQRQFDSAVWLGSDSTEGEDDAEFPDRVSTLDVLNQNPVAIPRIGDLLRVDKMDVKPSWSSEEMAEQEINQCVEIGKQEIDLSLRGLRYLSNSAIKPLSTIVSVPMGNQSLSYHPLQPKLKLFLSSNCLTRVPGEIFNLDNLSVLSLRSNSLTELPAAMGKLRRLVELNIANNNLHFLPYEILQILSEPSKLHSLTWHPNPFYEPDVPTGRSIGDKPYPPDLRDGVLSQGGRPGAVSSSLPENNSRWNVEYKYRSEIRFMHIDGTLAKGPGFLHDKSLFSSSIRQRNSMSIPDGIGHSNVIKVATLDDDLQPPKASLCINGARASKAPSLLEVVIQTWYQLSSLPELHDWLGDEPPERLGHILKDTKVLKEMEAGFRKCTICQRRFIIPRTEWLEWWQISKAGQKSRQLASAESPLKLLENRRDQIESMVPLIRRGCSWRCLPDKM